MSVDNGDNEDLQTYLDSFNTEIEEGESLVTLAPETVEALAGVDAIAQRILHPDDIENEVLHDDEDGVYYVDQSGNYYFQASSKAEMAPRLKATTTAVDKSQRKATKVVSISTKKSNKNRVSTAQVPEAGTNNEKEDNCVVILNSEVGKKWRSSDAVDPDDPDINEVYDFDETEDAFDQRIDFVPGKVKVIRLKPKSSASGRTSPAYHGCAHCGYTSNKRYLLSRHMKTHSDIRPYKCSVCERGFKTNASLMNHVNTHLRKKPHACKDCESSFTTSGELVRHVRYRHTGEKPHKCSECEYSSVELSKLRRHMRCHTGERPYQCPHCTYASPDTFKLKRHLRTHTGEKPYECDICHARFTQSNSLKGHRLIHSVSDKPIFQCSLCPTTCGRKTDLRLHIQKLHTSDKPLKCKRCGKELPDRYSYKVHIKTHEGEKCFRCDSCPYAAISMRHLISHKLTHTNEKPFTCETCNLSFRQRQLLTRHNNLYHTENYVPPKPREKFNACPHCDRNFTHKGNLLRHMEIHDPDCNVNKKLKPKTGRLSKCNSDSSVKSKIAGEIWGSDFEVTETEAEPEAEKVKDQVDEEEEEEFIDETVAYEIIETECYEKPIIMASQDMVEKYTEGAREIEKVPVKKEPGVKNFMTVQVDGNGRYMVVEVSQCEEEDEDVHVDQSSFRVENAKDIETRFSISDERKNPNIANCFGFEEESDDEFDELDEPKETIQLLDIIDED